MSDSNHEHLRLTHALMLLFDRWQADHQTQALLLGLGLKKPREMRRHDSMEVPYPEECIPRVQKLLRLGRTIETMLPHNPDVAQSWMRQPNRMFGGLIPLDVILTQGEHGIDALQNYLDGASPWT